MKKSLVVAQVITKDPESKQELFCVVESEFDMWPVGTEFDDTDISTVSDQVTFVWQLGNRMIDS